MEKINYRAFCKDMMKLCKKYKIKISAYDEGDVYIAKDIAKCGRDFDYDFFIFSAKEAKLEPTHYNQDQRVIELKEEDYVNSK